MLASVCYKGGEERRAKEGDGDGEERAREHERQGRGGVLGWRVCKRERKMIVRACQRELKPLTDSASVPLILSPAKASLFIQSFRDTHFHCMKIQLSSFYLLHISAPSSSFSVVSRNVLMWAHFHYGIHFPKIKATGFFP